MRPRCSSGASAAGVAPLVVGTVKSNIGHLECAAGIAGIIKACLTLHHGVIPRSLHYVTANEHVDFASLNIAVAAEQRALPNSGSVAAPPIVGISSFGFGGTNAHVVLQQMPRAVANADVERSARAAELSDAQRRRLFVLSAHSRSAVALTARRLAGWVESQANAIDLSALSATLALRRCHNTRRQPHRIAVVACSAAELIRRLSAAADEVEAPDCGAPPSATVALGSAVRSSAPLRIALVFTGQGSQHAHMGRGLFRDDMVSAIEKAV